MTMENEIRSYDERRDIAIPGNKEATLRFCIENFIAVARKSIEERGAFSVALSGGSTPKAIYELLTQPQYRDQIDWNRALIFWSDERSVPPTDPESNYHMAMEAGLKTLPIPKDHIFRMEAEHNIEENALKYDELIKTKLSPGIFDLVMLGMGDDGHTAPLFPKTHGLHSNQRLAIANFIPQKDTWRMTLTFECINQARHIAFYVLGKSKAEMLKRVLSSPYDPDLFPSQRVGTPTHKALWIADRDAAHLLNGTINNR
jgi:6-phosphogluconolactonase